MCRHLAYLGPPVPLSTFLFAPPHSLNHQSWAPRDMRGGGTINADGYGVGWFGPGGPPVRHRRATPMWSSDFAGTSAFIRSHAMLAAVRSATEGMPVVESANAPFADDRWLFSHNGVVDGWPASMVKLGGTLPVSSLLTMDAPTDSALLWALIRDRMDADPAHTVLGVVHEVARAAPGSRLNLLLTDGASIIATTFGHSLSVLRRPGSVLVASEPLDDDPAWSPVPDRTLLVATATELTYTSLGDA